MRPVLLAAVLLGFAVTANGQTAFQSRHGQFVSVDNAWWRADARVDDTTVTMRNLVLWVNGLELHADEATAARVTAEGDSQVFTLTGTVTITIPAGESAPGE